jgi:hypothetical protein
VPGPAPSNKAKSGMPEPCAARAHRATSWPWPPPIPTLSARRALRSMGSAIIAVAATARGARAPPP